MQHVAQTIAKKDAVLGCADQKDIPVPTKGNAVKRTASRAVVVVLVVVKVEPANETKSVVPCLVFRAAVAKERARSCAILQLVCAGIPNFVCVVRAVREKNDVPLDVVEHREDALLFRHAHPNKDSSLRLQAHVLLNAEANSPNNERLCQGPPPSPSVPHLCVHGNNASISMKKARSACLSALPRRDVMAKGAAFPPPHVVIEIVACVMIHAASAVHLAAKHGKSVHRAVVSAKHDAFANDVCATILFGDDVSLFVQQVRVATEKDFVAPTSHPRHGVLATGGFVLPVERMECVALIAKIKNFVAQGFVRRLRIKIERIVLILSCETRDIKISQKR